MHRYIIVAKLASRGQIKFIKYSIISGAVARHRMQSINIRRFMVNYMPRGYDSATKESVWSEYDYNILYYLNS